MSTASPASLPDPTAPLLAASHRAVSLRFDDHAQSAPDRLAVADWARRWTYRELQSRANQLAHWLLAKGVGPADVVAIHAERNAFTVWAMLGVLKSGAAFMLLDADYPTERIVAHVKVGMPAAWIDAAATGASAALGAAQGVPAHRIALASASEELRGLPTTSPAVELPREHRAYVVFTSGTTGAPKAAPATGAALAHFVEWQAATFALTAEDRFSALSGLAHLPFTRDVFTPLSIGASIHVPPQELRLEPDRLAQWLTTNHVSVCHLTPSLAEVLTLAKAGTTVPDLRWVFFAGEPLRAEVVDALRRVAPRTGFVNFYGASETAQSIAYLVVERTTPGIMPIGRGIDRVQLLLVKDDDTLAAVGEEGEIWVRTPYLAAAYLNGDAGGFGVNPFTRDPEDRVYRTGDRGRYLPDGSVQVLGRRDDQVKVRGFRVELREVEEAIQSYEGVARAVVILREETRSLVAYVVGRFESGPLLESLRRRLPDYMVPAAVVLMDRMPLTANGKLDKKALPPPPPNTATSADAPADDTEEAIAVIWQDVLGCDVVGRSDNFFDLGGHSLNATQVASRLRDHFKVEIPVRTLFDAPTVAELAKRVRDLASSSSSV